jgi:hypothetical protein
MATKKTTPKKATKKVTPKKATSKKATSKKKVSKKESLDFSLVLLGTGSKDNFDITLDIKGNSLSLGVALGQLMTEDKNLEAVFKVAVDYYMRLMNKKVKPISKVVKGKKPKK